MHPRFILAALAALIATPALAQPTYYPGYEEDYGGRGYARRVIIEEGFREPVYDVQTVPRYAAPSGSAQPRVIYVMPRDYQGTGTRTYSQPRGARMTNAGASQSVAPMRRAVPEQFLKQEVSYDGAEEPGTVVIDTGKKFLYLVQPGGTALRYGVGVGRPGFSWKGSHKVTAKKEWPSWRPPAEMLARRPDLPAFMEGGPDNPLGARAMYLGSTLYRIHGSNEPWTIGTAVSSGCFRMTNDDVTDLYTRVSVGTKVIVR